MQDADGHGFEEVGRTLELSSPARGRGRERVSGRAAWKGPDRRRDNLPPRPSLASEGG